MTKSHFYNRILKDITYGGTPCTWLSDMGREGYLLDFTHFKKEFKSEKELLQWMFNNHKKWEPGYVIKFKNKIIVGGWVAR